jgi:hypothetical protein
MLNHFCRHGTFHELSFGSRTNHFLPLISDPGFIRVHYKQELDIGRLQVAK